jgi:hypothetical protein
MLVWGRLPMSAARPLVVGQFEKAACTPPAGVILSAAAFQAERRTSRLTGPARKPNCTTTEIQNLRNPT